MFLFSVVTVYAVVGIIEFDLVRNALPVLGKLILRISPILMLVFGIMFLTNLLFEAKGIIRNLGKGSGLRGWLLAISGGIVSAGPI